jgi:hypothetical protein
VASHLFSAADDPATNPYTSTDTDFPTNTTAASTGISNAYLAAPDLSPQAACCPSPYPYSYPYAPDHQMNSSLVHPPSQCDWATTKYLHKKIDTQRFTLLAKTFGFNVKDFPS